MPQMGRLAASSCLLLFDCIFALARGLPMARTHTPAKICFTCKRDPASFCLSLFLDPALSPSFPILAHTHTHTLERYWAHSIIIFCIIEKSVIFLDRNTRYTFHQSHFLYGKRKGERDLNREKHGATLFLFLRRFLLCFDMMNILLKRLPPIFIHISTSQVKTKSTVFVSDSLETY